MMEEKKKTLFLTVPEVCAELQLGPAAVYALCKAGTIPSVRSGRVIRISRPALEKWAANLGQEEFPGRPT